MNTTPKSFQTSSKPQAKKKDTKSHTVQTIPAIAALVTYSKVLLAVAGRLARAEEPAAWYPYLSGLALLSGNPVIPGL